MNSKPCVCGHFEEEHHLGKDYCVTCDIRPARKGSFCLEYEPSKNTKNVIFEKRDWSCKTYPKRDYSLTKHHASKGLCFRCKKVRRIKSIYLYRGKPVCHHCRPNRLPMKVK